MLKNYSTTVQNLLSKAESQGLFSPFARVYYTSKIQTRRETEKMWGTIVAQGVAQENEIFAGTLQETSDIFLKLLSFPDYLRVSELEFIDRNTREFINSEKLLIVVYLSELSEGTASELRAMNSETQEGIEILVVYTGENKEQLIELKKEKQWSLKTAWLQDTAEAARIPAAFGQDYPFAVVFCQQRVIWTGKIEEAKLAKWGSLCRTRTLLEACSLISPGDLPAILVEEAEGRASKALQLDEGLILLEFWDEALEHTLADNQQLLSAASSFQDIEFISVYAGSQRISSGLILSSRTKSETLLKLKIVDLPASFLVQNGVVIWRGNRLFDAVQVIVESLSEASRLPSHSQYEISLEEFKQLKEKYKDSVKSVLGSSGVDLEFQFSSRVDITRDKCFPQKALVKLVGYALTEEEEASCLEIHRQLQAEFEYITIDIIKLKIDPDYLSPPLPLGTPQIDHDKQESEHSTTGLRENTEQHRQEAEFYREEAEKLKKATELSYGKAERLKEENNSLNQENRELKQESLALQSELAKSHEEAQQNKEETQSLKQANKHLKSAAGSLQRKQQSLAQSIASQEQLAAKLQQHLEQVEEENKSLESRNSALKSELYSRIKHTQEREK